MNKYSKVKILSSKIIYDKHGRQVAEDTLEFADGTRTDWVFFNDGDAVAIAAFTKDNKIILTKQYRHPFGNVVPDLPGGAVHEGEAIAEAAKRELLEETGFSAKNLTQIGQFIPGPSTRVIVHVFMAQDAIREDEYDKEEIADIELIDYSKILKRVKAGELFSADLTIAVLLCGYCLKGEA